MAKQSLPQLINLFFSLRRRKTPTLLALIIVAAAVFGGSIWKSGGEPKAGECSVVKIYDGDTMTLRCSGRSEPVKVRMYCIDTPEMQQKPWGEASRDHLRKIAGERVKLVEIERDRYGRTVGEVIASDGSNLNLAQIEAGKAAVYEAYCKKPEYAAAQARAQAAKQGIWAQSGMQQTPWDWRKDNK